MTSNEHWFKVINPMDVDSTLINHSITKHVCNRLKYVSLGKHITVTGIECVLKHQVMENNITFHPLEAVGRGSETQLRVSQDWFILSVLT